MLEGLTALDLTGLQGQFAGRILADLGMRVVKVEPPGGDPVRAIGPFKDDAAGPETSLRFAFLNGGKESVTLDLETAEGRELLLGLVERADVLLESFEPGYLAGLGLGYETLKERKPGLVMAAITPFGQYGPHADYHATDIVGVAMGGLMFISGAPELPPVRPPETQGYYYASVFAAYGVLLSLWAGEGRYIDVSMQEAVATQEHMIREAAFDGVAIVRNGSQHKHAAPANIFSCKDGHVFLFVLGPRDWGAAARALGRPPAGARCRGAPRTAPAAGAHRDHQPCGRGVHLALHQARADGAAAGRGHPVPAGQLAVRVPGRGADPRPRVHGRGVEPGARGVRGAALPRAVRR